MTILSKGFCFISPLSVMKNLDSFLGNNHLALAHLVNTNDEYANWFANRPDTDFVIMDNGAFELGQSYTPDQLISLGQKCRADVIVLPDYPNQPWQRTLDAGIQWNSTFHDAGFKTMYVPQSEIGDLDGWLRSYQSATNLDTTFTPDVIGMSILGIPNALPHIDKTFARVVITDLLIRDGLFNFNIHHHYLGLNSGPKLEIPTLLKMKALSTCDSSGPVWGALNKIKYANNTDSYMKRSKLQKPIDFEYQLPLSLKVTETILHNIELTNKLFE